MSSTATATLRIETPRAMIPLLRRARYKGAHGGRGGTKSWGFADMVIERMVMDANTRVVCIREVQKSLKQSVKRLLEDRIKALGVGHYFHVLETEIRCTHGDGIVIFVGMQDHTAQSIKSLEGFDIAWVEESQSLSDRSLELLRPTIRKAGSELWFSWNPRHSTDPVDAFLRGPNPPPDSIIVEVGWEDNPWLPQTLRDEINYDRDRDTDKYEHVWGGGYEKATEARVFKNWVVRDFDTPPDTAFLFGADWGYANDPSTGVRMWVEDRKLYIDAEVYKIGCEIDDTPALFDALGCSHDHTHTPELINAPGHEVGSLNRHCEGLARNWAIRADSARPETIAYLNRHNYPRMESATKGPNSVKEGVEFIKNYDVVIHPRCIHTIDEFKTYSYVVHPLTGETMPILADKKNHVIDSVRYALEPLRDDRPTILVM